MKMWTKDLYYPRNNSTRQRFIIRDTDHKVIGFIDGEENAEFVINSRKQATATYLSQKIGGKDGTLDH